MGGKWGVKTPCRICGKDSIAKHLCWKHYVRLRRTGTTRLKTRYKKKSCQICGHKRNAGSSLYCKKHWRQKRRQDYHKNGYKKQWKLIKTFMSGDIRIDFKIKWRPELEFPKDKKNHMLRINFGRGKQYDNIYKKRT